MPDWCLINWKQKTMKKLLPIISSIFLFFFFQTAFAQNKTLRQKKVPQTIVSCGICNQKALSLPKPEYPKAGTFVNVSGKVNVQILIDEKGNVIEAKAVSGHPLLKPTSEKAALQAKFEPLLLSGNPVKVRGLIVYNFVPDSPIQQKQIEEKLQQTEIPKGKTIIDLAGGTVIGVAIKLLKPTFPLSCRCKFSKNLKAVVQFTVDENGNVESAYGIAGHTLLRAASIVAVRNSKFSISTINGAPIKAFGIIIYDFVISRNRWKTLVVKHELKLKK